MDINRLPKLLFAFSLITLCQVSLVARNPQKCMANYKQATQADFQNATRRVYFSGANSSAIVLPISKK